MIKIRLQKISDAEKFFEILNSPNFTYFNVKPESVKAEKKRLTESLKLTRLEIVMQPENKGSEKVAIKNNYYKEGLLKKAIKYKDGSMKDCFLYAKVL
jgi:[ribosomal protein S5]-alanine N-acetyltransferase